MHFFKIRRKRLSRDTLSCFIVFISLGFSGAAWIPAFHLSGLTVELSNLSTIICISILLVYISKVFRVRIPLEARFWLVSLVSVTLMFLMHGGDGISITIRSLLAFLGALLIFNIPLPKVDRFVNVVNFSFIIFIFLIWASSKVVGLSLISAVTDYLSSFDRHAFTYHFMRVLFNAFSQGREEQYVASVINAIAASLTMFYLISASLVVAGFYKMLPVALSSLTACFILFSTSSIIACTLGSMMIFICWIKHQRNIIAPIFVLIGICSILFFSYEIFYSYFEFNLNSDTTSRAHRLHQIEQSLNSINENLFFGVGHIIYNGYEIHNWLLFSWVSGGLITGALALLANASVVLLISHGFLSALRNKQNFHMYLIVATLPIIFLISVNVGGGGGSPSGPPLISFAVAIAFKYAAKNLRKSTM